MIDKFIIWWNQYSTGIIAFATTGGIGAGAFVLRKQIAKLAQKIVNILVKIVMKLYGGDIIEDEITMAFEELPFVTDLKLKVNQMKIDDEMKLVQLKQRLLSPRLGEVEKISYTYQYNLLIGKIGKDLTSETKNILEKMETSSNSAVI